MIYIQLKKLPERLLFYTVLSLYSSAFAFIEKYTQSIDHLSVGLNIHKCFHNSRTYTHFQWVWERNSSSFTSVSSFAQIGYKCHLIAVIGGNLIFTERRFPMARSWGESRTLEILITQPILCVHAFCHVKPQTCFFLTINEIKLILQLLANLYLFIFKLLFFLLI